MAAPRSSAEALPREPALSFFALLLMVLGVRLAAHFALPQPLQSDGLAYFTLANTMAHGHWPADHFGQHAFYSIGYPLVLAPFFAVLGAKTGVAFAVNLLLALLSAGLLVLVGRGCRLSPQAQKLALLGYALWLPGVWNCTMLARENLSTPLLLAVVWCALRLLEAPSARRALAAGAAWGAAVLAGSSALPLVMAPTLAILLAARAPVAARARALAMMAAGAALVLAPWGLATRAMLGAPTLSTNTGFNLYIGNNPAATGRFVSIAATPMGPRWHQLLATRGEVGATQALGEEAQAWIAAHPLEATRLAATKLALFWAPNLPDARDIAASPAMAVVRLGEVTQYLLFVVLGVAALASRRIARPHRAVMLAAIAGFWALHALAYIIDRYRDPVMPLMILLAASALAELLQTRFFPATERPHAA